MSNSTQFPSGLVSALVIALGDETAKQNKFNPIRPLTKEELEDILISRREQNTPVEYTKSIQVGDTSITSNTNHISIPDLVSFIGSNSEAVLLAKHELEIGVVLGINNDSLLIQKGNIRTTWTFDTTVLINPLNTSQEIVISDTKDINKEAIDELFIKSKVRCNVFNDIVHMHSNSYVRSITHYEPEEGVFVDTNSVKWKYAILMKS